MSEVHQVLQATGCAILSKAWEGIQIVATTVTAVQRSSVVAINDTFEHTKPLFDLAYLGTAMIQRCLLLYTHLIQQGFRTCTCSLSVQSSHAPGPNVRY